MPAFAGNSIVDDAPHGTIRTLPSRLPYQEEALDKAMIAALSDGQIARMTREELVRVIRVTHMSYLSLAAYEELDYFDRPTLERLAYLSRRCCRNQGY